MDFMIILKHAVWINSSKDEPVKEFFTIVTYNHQEKCHNLKVNLNVPLIMGYERDAEASRRTLCVGERSSLPIRRKPKSGHDYSTVTLLARLRGLSTSNPLNTPM